MPKHHSLASGLSARHIEPRDEYVWRQRRAELALELQVTGGTIEVPHASEHIHNRSEASLSCEPITPVGGAIAIHFVQKLLPMVAGQASTDLLCVTKRIGQGPAGQHARVDEEVLTLCVREGPMPKPMKQVCSVGCGQDIGKRVRGSSLACAAGHGQKMQVMVAQYGDRVRSSRSNEAQDFSRLGPTVDEVAHAPELISPGLEFELRHQGLEAVCTALNISNCINRHRAIVK